MDQDRRTFLATLGAAALGESCRTALGAGQAPAKSNLSRLGIQLCAVRKQAAADLPGVFARLAQIGYKEVEFAATYHRPVAEVRDLLKANGLTAPSAHFPFSTIAANPAKTFADAHTVGQQWFTTNTLPFENPRTADDWKRVAARFNAAAAPAKAAGLRFAYHNYNDAVKTTSGVAPIEILMAETDPSLVFFQMDVFWTVSGGANPIALLARYPGRYKMLHIKDGVAPYNDA